MFSLSGGIASDSLDNYFYFQNQTTYFLDTLIQKAFFKFMIIHKFRGDLTDISAQSIPLRWTTRCAFIYSSDFVSKPTYILLGNADPGNNTTNERRL